MGAILKAGFVILRYFGKQRLLNSIIFILSCSSPAAFNSENTHSDIILGIANNQFTVNGQPTFLLGVSYFDGKNYHESDFVNLAAKGFNLIRIWLDWRDSNFFDENGNWLDGAKQVLLNLVDQANSHGLVVDVTILDSNMSFGDSASKRLKAMENVTLVLKGKNNVLFDLANEHDHNGFNTVVSHNEAQSLLRVVKNIDPNRIVTISSTACHLLCGNDRDGIDENNITEEINQVGVDVLTPHFMRNESWADKTRQRVTTLMNYLLSIDKSIPIYLQEENRRSNDSGPDTADFFTAAKQAKEAGAAGWIFHTKAGYDLKESNFFENLDPHEHVVLNELADLIYDNSEDDSLIAPPTPPIGVKAAGDN